MEDELKYTVTESLMSHIYLALYNRQKYANGGMLQSNQIDYEVAYCISELDKIYQLKNVYISDEHISQEASNETS